MKIITKYDLGEWVKFTKTINNKILTETHCGQIEKILRGKNGISYLMKFKAQCWVHETDIICVMVEAGSSDEQN